MVSEYKKYLTNAQHKTAFLQQLFKGMQSSKWVKKLKYLMAIHYLIIHS
jgi:hypothetical protein